MKFKLNDLEKKWILYDVGNSAFTLLVSTIMPIYFNYLAGNAGVSDVDYLAYWGYAVSVSTVIVAILGPVLGTFSDFPGWKRKIFLTVMLIGALGCVFLGFTSSWLWFLLVFVIAKSRLFPESGGLRFHAYGCYRQRPDGRGILPRLCLGLYRKLYPLYHQPASGVIL